MEELQEMLRKQLLIIRYIKQKLQIVNFIKNGYDTNRPILINNSFLHFTARIFYRSIIIDLYALFGRVTKNNKNAFGWFNEEKYKVLLKPKTVETVNNWILQSNEKIEIIKNLRNKQIAHYDFIEQISSINFNLDNLSELNSLYCLAQKIISHCGQSFKDESKSLDFEFGNIPVELISLEDLVK